MSEENVEVVRAIYERFSEGDFHASVDLLDRHIVFTLDPNAPDADVWVGVEAVAAAMRGLFDTWADFTLKAEEFIPVGDTVLVSVRQQGVARISGVPSDEHYFTLWSFRGRKVIRIENFRERAQALEAAGLREYALSQENVELVRRLFTLWNRTSGVVEEAADLAGEFFDPDVEWHDQRELPGATVHHGIEEVGRHLAATQEALDYERTDLLELLDADPRVFAAYRFHARGRASGTPVERDAFHVYSFRGARIACVEIFGTRSEALEAAGLAE